MIHAPGSRLVVLSWLMVFSEVEKTECYCFTCGITQGQGPLMLGTISGGLCAQAHALYCAQVLSSQEVGGGLRQGHRDPACSTCCPWSWELLYSG